MSKDYWRLILVVVCSTVFLPQAFAQKSWNQTGGGMFSWSTSGNWTPPGVPGSGDDARVTNNLAGAQLITGASGTINYLAVSNGLGAATVNIITATPVGLTPNFGVQLGKNAVLMIAGNSTFGQNVNVTFSLREGGEPSTLVVSNSAVLVLNAGGGKPLLNAGTIHLTALAVPPQNSQINYGQTASFTNQTNGTIVKMGRGTGSFVGEWAGSNRPFINDGTIIIQDGAFRMDPRDAFAAGGFENRSTGHLQIDATGVMEIRRTANAWLNGPAPTNSGVVFMNGGTLRTFSDGAADNTRTNVNLAGGVVLGNGLLDFQLRNQGVVEARDGTLTGIGAAGNIGTWVSTNFGGAESVLNFITGNFDLGAGTLLNSNGTIRLAGGANGTVSTSYRANFGTISLGGAHLFVANSAAAGPLTNELTIVKSGGAAGTITTGYGSGQNNYGFINKGSILFTDSPTLTINVSDTFANAFTNAPTGLIELSTAGSQFQINRTANAWNGGAAPVNAGVIALPATSGTVSMLSDGALDATRAIRNAGVISAGGSGAIGNWAWNGSVNNTADGTVGVTNGSLGGLRFSAANAGTITIRSGATLPTATASLTNNARINLLGGTLAYTNAAGGVPLHNQISGVITGSGTILLGYGFGANNYSLVNAGSIIASGGVLAINPNDAFTNGGFSNTVTGTTLVESGSELRIIRSDNAWTGFFGSNVVNHGIIRLNGGIVSAYDSSGLNSARVIRNVGTIIGNGTVNASITNLSGAVVSPGLSIGTNTVSGSVVFGSNSTFVAELGAAAGQNDLLAIAGNLTLDADSILDISGGTVGNVHTVMTFSARSGTFGSNSPGYNVTYTAGAITIAPVPTTHTITATAGANGSIAPSGAVVVNSGSDQTFTITPDACYQIADVLVDSVSVGAVPSHTFNNVTADHTISASFAINTYTITASAGANGSISPYGPVSVDCGSDQTFTITPDAGYHIVDVLVDSVSVGPVTSHTFNNVTANRTISASFAINTYTITATAGANGSIDPAGAVVVNHGDSQAFTITPDSCYHVADVLVNSLSVGAVTSHTINNVTADQTIDASFAIDTYTITATAGANGSISPSGAVSVDCGTDQTFTVTPAAGHPIVDVQVDAASFGPINSYTFTAIGADHTIDALFATELFRILSITREGADVRLAWTVVGGTNYVLQSTTGSGGSFTNNFTDLTTIAIPGIGESTTNYLHIGATTVPATYYRVIIP